MAYEKPVLKRECIKKTVYVDRVGVQHDTFEKMKNAEEDRVFRYLRHITESMESRIAFETGKLTQAVLDDRRFLRQLLDIPEPEKDL